MDRLVDHLFVFEGEGVIRDFPGNYTDYRLWLEEEGRRSTEARSGSTVKVAAAKSTPEESGSADNRQKLSFKEKREYEQLEQDIERLEQEKEALHQMLNSGTPDHNLLAQWGRELELVEAQLEAKSDRWLELAERV